MKIRIMLIALLLSMLVFTGCGKKASERVSVTMYLWDTRVMSELTPWLEEQFPDIDFTFVVGYNTMSFYTDLNTRGSLPDIITCRRFSLNDATELSDALMDLSETDIVGSFYDSYIENNRETSGAIRWLPLCAEVDGYIANLDLFEVNHIPVPATEKEFADACLKFEELGIRGYTNDYRMDYSCMEALQGSAIPKLMSMEGVQWRAAYESEATQKRLSLDEKVWPVVFEKFEQYMADTRVTPEDNNVKYENMRDAFREGKSAVIRGTAADCLVFRGLGMNSVMLPYFGETPEERWILTYPAFQVAVNKAVGEDDRKNDAVLKVLTAMFSQEGQRHVVAGNAALTYNKNVDFEMNETFSEITDCIDSNQMYIRLASTEMFTISKSVVRRMIAGDYDAEAACADFLNQLNIGATEEPEEIVYTQRSSYEYDYGEHGSHAASAVINTLRRQSGEDIAIGIANVIASDVFSGDYTKTQLNRLLSNSMEKSSGMLTGAQVKSLMEWLINEKEDGTNPIRHKNLMPVTSGMEYVVEEKESGTFVLKELLVNGEAPEDNDLYSVALFGDIFFLEDTAYCGCPMPEPLRAVICRQEDNVYTLFRTALEEEQMEEPADYVTIRR